MDLGSTRFIELGIFVRIIDLGGIPCLISMREKRGRPWLDIGFMRKSFSRDGLGRNGGFENSGEIVSF